MRAGSSTATITDYKLLFGVEVYPSDTALSLLATHLRKLEDARITLGLEVTEDTFVLGRLMEMGHAISDITDLRTTRRAKTDSVERMRFFSAHPQMFRWQEPHFIGLVVLTSAPGTAKSVADSLRTLPDPSAAISKEFRVISYNVEKGLNPYVDFAAFNLPAKLPESDRWKDAAVIEGETLTAPHAPEDMAELLTTLLADSLYTVWIDSLSNALPIEIDSKSLDFLKNNVTH